MRKELPKLPQVQIEMPTLAELGIKEYQKRNIKTKKPLSTKAGKREYMKKYMRLRRKEKKSR